MNITRITIAAAVATLAVTAVSCSKKSDITGAWTAEKAISIVKEIPEAATASSRLSIDFANSTGNDKGGSFFLSSIIDLTQPVNADAGVIDAPYEVSVAATASVTGNWTYVENTNDDITLDFNMSTLNVNVDPTGVSFSQNLLTGVQKPMLDSITGKTLEHWQTIITAAVKENLPRLANLHNVKVGNKGYSLTVRTDGNEELSFAKNGEPQI